MVERISLRERKSITDEDVVFWLGTSNAFEEAIDVITSIARGSYHPEVLARDILDYKEDSDEV